MFVYKEEDMRRTKSDAEQTKHDLVMAALKLFSENGYSATNLADIAKRAGTTRGAIYWHFENKDHLFSYLIEQGMNYLCNYIEYSYQQEGTFLDRTKRLFVSFRDLDSYELALFNFIKDNFIQVRKIPSVQSIFETFYQRAIKALNIVEKEVLIAQKHGELDENIDSGALSVYILNFLALIGIKSSPEIDLRNLVLGREVKDFSEDLIDFAFKGLNSIKKKS